VVVINFLNERNAADQRVYELLSEKFTLFSGLFGASDEVLGSIESGVDFERRVLDIYQECRTPAEIEAAFKALRKELDESISARIQETRKMLLEYFDEDVHARLKANLEGTREQLDRFGRMFWALTRHVLDGRATFDDKAFTFDLAASPATGVQVGHYRLISKEHENERGDFLYRLGHPLGEHVIRTGQELATPVGHVDLNISGRSTRITQVQALKGKTGWLVLQRLVIESFDREEYLLFSGFTESGSALDQETCQKLFQCDGRVRGTAEVSAVAHERLAADADRHVRATLNKSLEQNNRHFTEAREQLEKWADDMILGVEKELKDTKEQIKALARQARQAATVEEQHEIQTRIQELEKKKRRQRQQIFEVEDEITRKRDELVDALERRMQQRTTVEPLFTIRWSVK
jgi:hypothetical protein